jgi:hypothetical protein
MFDMTSRQYLPELRRNKGEGQLTTQTILPPVWDENSTHATENAVEDD